MPTGFVEVDLVSPFARLNSGMLPLRRAILRKLKSRFPRLDYAVWSWRNPGKTFKNYYAESVVAALDGRKQHASLGPRLKEGREKQANRTFDQLVAYGISPADTLVDYGCGTLRLGRYFIELLEPERYIGLDIDGRILDAGLRSLPAELIASKRPMLELISRESLIRVAAKRPKWIFAKGVLQHVPPAELNEFFANLAPLVRAGATGFIYARVAKARKALSAKTWLHGLRELQATAEAHGMHLSKESRNLLKLRG
jgi:hypothetical protein